MAQLIRGFYSHSLLSLLIILALLFPSWGQTVEPPFSPDTLQQIIRLSSFPTLISTDQILQGIDPESIKAFATSSPNTKNSQPNPIAETFPNATTGTINGTLAVLPIEYSLARSIIPNKYKILKKVIEAALPGFPPHKYPLILWTRIDHDIKNGGIGISDFSSAGFRFPFVDLLGDGYSTFSYIRTGYISPDPIAIAAIAAYGQESISATFDPAHDPYDFVPPGRKAEKDAYFLNVYKTGISVLNTTYAPHSGRAGSVGAYPLSFYANVTNQPIFSCNAPTCLLTCDNMINFFRTRITTGQFAPVGVTGSVSLAKSSSSGFPFFPHGRKWKGVHGIKLDTAFLENNYKDCSNFKGYSYMNV